MVAVNLKHGYVAGMLSQRFCLGPYDVRVEVMLDALLEFAEEIDPKASPDPPLPFGIARAVQSGQDEATAHEQSRAKCPFRADLDKVDERFVLRCDVNHWCCPQPDPTWRLGRWLHRCRTAGISD